MPEFGNAECPYAGNGNGQRHAVGVEKNRKNGRIRKAY